MKVLKYVTEDENIDKCMQNTILSYFILNGDRVYWNPTMILNIFCDVIMHLLFLGITKASKHLLSLWLEDTKSKVQYDQCVRQLLLSLTDLSLEWCKIIASEFGWVSDNYLAYSRIVKW